jgi:hypothetical protein
MMETMMSDQHSKFANGDKVRHPGRPEWGVGTILKAEIAADLPMNGHPKQRLSVRFPNAGIKTIVTGYADLVRVTDNIDPITANETEIAQYWNRMSESDWLGDVARKKVEQAMITLPEDVRDPFASLAKRLSLTLGLYRFDRSGRGLMDWAVAQTGLDDPLSKFTRHELEQKFDRWAFERENYLAKLLQEARAPGAEHGALQIALKTAPPTAQEAVRRLASSR